jgi:hypothetical protein
VKLDPDRTRLTVRTEVKGLLAAIAHALELRAEGLSGGLEGDVGHVHVPIAGLRVVGSLKHGVVDPSALSARDKAEIERRLREEVLVGGTTLEIGVALAGSAATFSVRAPRGSQQVRCELRRDGLRASGQCALSLGALGIAPIKLPLGTGRVADRIEISFEAVLQP